MCYPDLLGGDEQVVGNMTSGGTESILMAVLAAREWARVHRPAIQKPEILANQAIIKVRFGCGI